MLAELVRLAELEAEARGTRTIALVPSTAQEMCSAVEVFVRDAEPAEVRQFLVFVFGLMTKKEAAPEPDEPEETPAEPAPPTEEGEPT